jgi:5-carboxymethyl-2-hydroxymuconate isomerase
MIHQTEQRNVKLAINVEELNTTVKISLNNVRTKYLRDWKQE